MRVACVKICETPFQATPDTMSRCSFGAPPLVSRAIVPTIVVRTNPLFARRDSISQVIPSHLASWALRTPFERAVAAFAGAAYDPRVRASRRDAVAAITLTELTARELEVLELTSGGLTNAVAAAQLGLTVHSVKFHLGSIYKKLGVKNRTEAAAIYFSTDTTHAPARDRKALSWT